MDLFSLLYREPEPIPRVGDPNPDPLVFRKRKIDTNWNNWLTGYIVYMSVVVQMQAARAGPMLKYLDIIYQAYREYAVPAWLAYDDHFRL